MAHTNPFEILKPEFSLHVIHKKREEILKHGEPYSPQDQTLLYRLRIAELLHLLDIIETRPKNGRRKKKK